LKIHVDVSFSRAQQTKFLMILKWIPQGFHVEVESSPDQFLSDFERDSIRIVCGHCRQISEWFWKEFRKGSIRNLRAPIPISDWFWKGCLRDSIWQMAQSSPDQFPIEFAMDSWRISYGNHRQIPDWFWKEFLKDSIWKLTQSSPDQFPIDSERD